jgi:xanthine dehydrogenase YagR molybdenum-binding subunit
LGGAGGGLKPALEQALSGHVDYGRREFLLVPEEDPHVNPMGAKGIGEVSMVGVAGAVANAVFNATGRRVRNLLITLDKLL